MKQELIDILKRLAERPSNQDLVDEDFIEFDFTFGGNFDDTYAAGIDDGETMLARSILRDEGIEFTIRKIS